MYSPAPAGLGREQHIARSSLMSQQNVTNWGPVMAVSVIMMLPPVFVFAALNKYFSVSGIGGSLAGR